jgi:hypothetical protein
MFLEQPRCLSRIENTFDMVNEFFVAIVYDIVCGHFYLGGRVA